MGLVVLDLADLDDTVVGAFVGADVTGDMVVGAVGAFVGADVTGDMVVGAFVGADVTAPNLL